ncbi:MAG: hypothetical protein NZ518_08795, partial [Dehalococcoidia bacterium]|nr:hypothetical protein [Dehalococcoidia bacterium]
GVRLLGYSLATPTATPGDTLQLTLFWQGTQPISERYTVFTHLIDPAELIWAQRDAEPGSGARPTTAWRPGEMFADRYGLPVMAGSPPGEYVLEVGLYRASDGVRLGVVDESGRVVADRVLLGPVTVDRPDRQPDVSALFIEHPRQTPHGPLTFLGYDLQKLGFDRGVTDFRPGDLAHLTLFWRAPSRPGADRPVVIELRDSAGRVAIRETHAVTNGLYPLSRWQAGDVVRDQHKLPLRVPAGQYRVFVGLEGERLMELGPLTVR